MGAPDAPEDAGALPDGTLRRRICSACSTRSRWSAPDVLGYSMGGRMALQLCAVARPSGRRRLFWRAARRDGYRCRTSSAYHSDEGWRPLSERDGLRRSWHAGSVQPLFASQQARPPAEFEAHCGRSGWPERSGRVGEQSARAAARASRPPLWERLGRLRLHCLIHAGELDANLWSSRANGGATASDGRVGRGRGTYGSS